MQPLRPNPARRRLRRRDPPHRRGTAAIVARTILGQESSATPSPYFWSDQFLLRLQHIGVPTGWTRVVLDEDADSLEARYLDGDNRLVGALLVNKPHAVSGLRGELATELLAA